MIIVLTEINTINRPSGNIAAVPVALQLIDVLTGDMFYLKLYGAVQAGFTHQEFDAALRDCPYIPDPVTKEQVRQEIWDVMLHP